MVSVNLFDMNSNNIIMNIDGKDIEMKPAICYDKVYDRWLVSECGKVWSLTSNRFLKAGVQRIWRKDGSKKIKAVHVDVSAPKGFWEDGSGYVDPRWNVTTVRRPIMIHKMIMDTWKPLYDNPPDSIVWEEWETVRDLPSVYNHISKTVVIDHIDDDPTNNHIDNLRRTTSWDNHHSRKSKGI
jgi:hypothetical protein